MTFQSDLAARGAVVDTDIAQITQQPTGTAHHDEGDTLGAAWDAAVAAARPPSVKRFPGDVAPGHIRWGLTLPIADATVPVGAHRAYFGGGQNAFAQLIASARADHARNVLPFPTCKPGPWSAVAAGRYDADLHYLAGGLRALGHDVVVSLHHEPVSGAGVLDDPSGAAGHLGMNRRFRGILDSEGAANVELVPVHMAVAYANVDIHPWFDPDVYRHAVGVDTYNETGGIGGRPWEAAVAFAASVDRKLVVGEWGVLEASPAHTIPGDTRIHDTRATFLAHGVAVACYFNSNANSVAPWTLTARRLTGWTADARLASSVPLAGE